jgi:hypothetical protein
VKKPGIVRECEHPGRPHQHGRECYLYDRCRCPLGRAWSAAKRQETYKLQVLGLHKPAVVDATGARRRLQALATLGYDSDYLAPLIGRRRETTFSLLTGRQPKVAREHDERIRRVYDDLWDKPRVGATKGERISISKAKGRAIRRGYAPPLQWDDDSIDDPNAEPMQGVEGSVVDWQLIDRVLAGRAEASVLAVAEKREAARAVLARGGTATQIAKRLGVSGETAGKWARELAA